MQANRTDRASGQPDHERPAEGVAQSRPGDDRPMSICELCEKDRLGVEEHGDFMPMCPSCRQRWDAHRDGRIRALLDQLDHVVTGLLGWPVGFTDDDLREALEGRLAHGRDGSYAEEYLPPGDSWHPGTEKNLALRREFEAAEGRRQS